LRKYVFKNKPVEPKLYKTAQMEENERLEKIRAEKQKNKETKKN